jgi:alkanesulfonate monooxygenase SsuD/methylene tetrahydromethanopterin reductase-like flavin-dependent oxidoreductase (luciferase family)
MLRLAATLADGVFINALGPTDVPQSLAVVRAAIADAGRDPAQVDIVCRVVLFPTRDREAAYAAARRLIAAYLNTPVYRAFHQWLGNDRLYGSMWERWTAGDRRGALDALSEEAVDHLIAIGDADTCRAFVQRYVAAGVQTPVLLFLAPDAPTIDAVRTMVSALAPRSGSSHEPSP